MMKPLELDTKKPFRKRCKIFKNPHNFSNLLNG